MKKIKQILAMSLACASFNVFADEDVKQQNHNFYIKAMGGVSITNDFDLKTRTDFDDFEEGYKSESSGFGEIGIGVWSEILRGSFELNYIKPFGSKFEVKDKDKIGKDYLKISCRSMGLSSNEIKMQMNMIDIKKSESKLELDDHHILMARVNADLVKQENYSLYISSGFGASYFGGTLKNDFEFQAKMGGNTERNIEVKLKKEFHLTCILGLGFDYKINDMFALTAKYDFVITNVDLKTENLTIKIKDIYPYGNSVVNNLTEVS